MTTRTTRTPAFWGFPPPPLMTWLPILNESYLIPSQKKTSQSYKFKEFAKISNLWILKQTLHQTHILKLLDNMCKYEMDLTSRAGVKYVFVFANTNTNTNMAYLYLYLIKFQTMYLYLIHRIWCIWQIRFQIHFFLGPFSEHKFMEHKLTWIFLINMLKSTILFQNKCIPIVDCVCALNLACQCVCDKPLV